MPFCSYISAVSNDWEADLELALAAARAAAQGIMRSFRTEQAVDYKTPTQPVTEADRAADRLLAEVLLRERPSYGWLSEETADNPRRLDCEHVWIVDPIDGTRSYIAGRPEFAISIALAHKGSVVLGVIANPATDEYFYAVTKEGAYAQAPQHGNAPARIHVSSLSTLDDARLAASRSEIKAGEFEAFAGELRVVPTGSTAYKMARVAAGEADIFLSRGPKSEWDIAAGDLIVREAGGSTTDLDGARLTYNRPDPRVNGIVSTNAVLHGYALSMVDRLPNQH